MILEESINFMAIDAMVHLMGDEYVNKEKIEVYDKPKGAEKRHKIELLFGEKINVIKEMDDGNQYEIEISIEGNMERAYISKKDRKGLEKGKLLEVYFIDVGQGDAMLIQTPSDKRILIDGGPDDSANKFITKLYNLKNRKEGPLDLHYVIMTHADKDHAEGLIKVLKNPDVTVHNIYHNGIGKYKRKKNKIGITDTEKKWLIELFNDTDIFENQQDANLKPSNQFSRLVSAINAAKVRTKERKNGRALIMKRVDNLTPDLFDGESGDLSIKFLGPINEGPDPPKLRWYGTDAQTINGNSVCFRLAYKKCKIMLCGDMNTSSEKAILKHYKKKLQSKHSLSDQDQHFADKLDLTAQIFKANHHGSEDFSEAFLKIISPSIGIVSSGIQPDYAHPRAVLLGCMGKYANKKTKRPVLFSTKLSVGYKKFNLKEWTASNLKKSKLNLESILDKISEYFMKRGGFWGTLFLKIRGFLNKNEQTRDETLDIPNAYKKLHGGTIFLRTDGEKSVIASRYYGPDHKKWEYYLFHFDESGNLISQLKSKPKSPLFRQKGKVNLK